MNVFRAPWFFCIVALLAVRGSCQESSWIFDINDVQDLDDPNKLLIVTQFYADFTEDVREAEVFKYFNKTVIESSQDKEWLSENAVLVAQAVGPSKHIKFDAAAPEVISRTFGNCITWFCLEDGRVVHLQIGYPEPEEFIQSAKWAREAISKLDDVDGENAAGNMKGLHWLATSLEDRRAFMVELEKMAANAEELKDASPLLPAVLATSELRGRRMTERFGKDFLSDHHRNEMLLALSEHATIEMETLHLLMSQAPLVQQRDLSPLVWRFLSGFRLWDESHSDVLDWLNQQKEKERPILLRIIDTDLPVIDVDEDAWLSKQTLRTQETAELFGVRTCSLGELALVAKALRIKELDMPDSPATLEYFLSNANGSKRRMLTNQDESAELRRAMEFIQK